MLFKDLHEMSVLQHFVKVNRRHRALTQVKKSFIILTQILSISNFVFDVCRLFLGRKIHDLPWVRWMIEQIPSFHATLALSLFTDGLTLKDIMEELPVLYF